jgi:hypothetical protein
MLEKQGMVVLTDEDLEQYNRGQVSDRVKQTWDLSFNDLKEVVETKQYVIVKTKV